MHLCTKAVREEAVAVSGETVPDTQVLRVTKNRPESTEKYYKMPKGTEGPKVERLQNCPTILTDTDRYWEVRLGTYR